MKKTGTTEEGCPYGQFACSTSNATGQPELCIPQSQQCDGISQCPNGEDEQYKHCS